MTSLLLQRSPFISINRIFSQISDLDVSRCREGRLDYLGSASFILIAGLMSCLMVNESIGDAFIDAVLPSFFSSIYLLADALYNISLLAILCPSTAVLGIFLYYRLIYRPAIKSHEERKTLLLLRKRSGDFGRGEKLLRQKTYKELNRRPRGFTYGIGQFIHRLLVLINDGIVTFIIYASDKRLKKRVAVESAFSYEWCTMNMPALHQGTIYSNRVRDCISEVRLKNAKDSANDGHYSVQKRKIVPNPPEITRMVKASHMWWTVDDGQSNSISGSHVHQPSIVFRSDYNIARESRKELRATIFFDTGEALLRMWSNISIATVHERDHDWKVELFEVPASALLKELQNIFDAFYPDGIPMSEVEKKEACELFREWIQDSSQSNGGLCLESRMVPFKAFHDWFYDLSGSIHDLSPDRLLTHILLLTHPSNGASADAVKLLRAVAPKRSNIIYTSSYPARQSPVVIPSSYTIYTENPSLGSPLIPSNLHNPGCLDLARDIKHHVDDDDLYSIYIENPVGGSLPDSIYPMNNLGGSPRNFTSPQAINDVLKGNDL